MKHSWSRRQFVQTAGSLAALSMTSPAKLSAATGYRVAIVAAPGDPAPAMAPPQWAAGELERALADQHVTVTKAESLEGAGANNVYIIAAGPDSEPAKDILKRAGINVPSEPEAFALVASRMSSRKVVLACGSDARGLVYGLLELADRIECGSNPIAALALPRPLREKPANRVRSINRCFVSEVEDKPWFHDQAMWPEYLTMLAANRFNQFNLTLGLGYDYPQPVTDSYGYFAYPFFTAVPGFESVVVAGLPNAERDQNLAQLRFISSECAARGMDFTLGLWNHAYVMSKNSKPTYAIEGLTPETHAPYCRDALYTLLKACPGITGLTMRVHGESGIPEGNYGFWETVFQGITKLDRTIHFNLHAKGTSQRMIAMAEATKMPVSLSPKYWAEHLGLSYQPASIRELEKPPAEPEKVGSLFELSSGARRFLRYSYGDLFMKGRKHDVYFRIWPGTQRTLLWGDPKLAAGDGRGFSMCGGLGVDLFEPLSFKARAGSGISKSPAARCSYADPSLAPRYDWEKFVYSYRVWGRYIYNPDADPAGCHRYLDKQLRAAGPAIAQALASASRILRIVATSHSPSAANWAYWPEMYTNMPIVDESLNTIYHDTPAPRVYGNVSPLDPQMFVSVNESVTDLLSGRSNSRYTPFEVAQWLETYSADADDQLEKAGRVVADAGLPAYRRAVLDIQIQNGLGKFFSAKIRSAALFEIYRQSDDGKVLEQAVHQYRKARDAWSAFATLAKGAYMDDVTYGGVKHMRGHWLDRLPAIDEDIRAMEAFAANKPQIFKTEINESQIRQVMSPAARPVVACRHTPAATFEAGTAQAIALQVSLAVTKVRLKYRRVNQALAYETAEMVGEHGVFRATIPADYTASPFSLQYYFEIQHSPALATMYPGLGPDLSARPYFLVEQA